MTARLSGSRAVSRLRFAPPADPLLKRAGAVFLCMLLVAGCAPRLARDPCPPNTPECKPVFVVYDAWHAGIILRKSDIPAPAVPEVVDFPHADMIEFSWGDKDYFPDPDPGVIGALRAAFWSGGSVLHVVGFSGAVKTFYRTGEVVQMRLTPQGHDRLLRYISDTFARTSPTRRSQPSPGLSPQGRFYPATRKFSLLRTCNTWVAEALKSAGLPVSPALVITSGSLGSQLEGIGTRE